MIIFVLSSPRFCYHQNNTFSQFQHTTMSCNNACFEVTINVCSDIILRAGIEAATTYYVLVKKIGSNNLYQRKITSTTEAGGHQVLIEKSLFPDGFFTPGNNYWLQLRTEADYTEVVPMPFGDPAVEYDCVTFSLVQFDIEAGDESEINVIGDNAAEEIPE